MIRILGIAAACVWLALATGAGAQETFSGNGYSSGNTPASPDLHKYLSPDGRWIDKCRISRDYPHVNTRKYGEPDRFPGNPPQGATTALNGRAARYVSCELDPCSTTGGFICWRNPNPAATPPTLQSAALQELHRQGCIIGGPDDITCPDPRETMSRAPRPPGAWDPGPTNIPPGMIPGPPGGMRPIHCHLTGTGFSCDPMGGQRPSPPPQHVAAQQPVLPCRPEPSPDQKQTLRKTGNEALDTLAGAGSQADRMINAFSQVIAGAAAQSLDPAAFAQKQIDNTGKLLNLLAEPNPQFNAQLGQATAALLAQAERDPAGTIGTASAQAVLGRAVSTAAGTACAATVQAVTTTTKRLRGAVQVVRKLKSIRDSQPNVPMGAGLCAGVNPDGLNFGCFFRAIAIDKRVENGFAWEAGHFNPNPGADLPARGPYITQTLREQYGDRRFRGLDIAQNLGQSKGWLLPMSFAELEQHMAKVGDGARGILFTNRPQLGVGHVINVSYDKGMMQILDSEAQPGRIAEIYQTLSHGPIRDSVKLFLFRTAGPDMYRVGP